MIADVLPIVPAEREREGRIRFRFFGSKVLLAATAAAWLLTSDFVSSVTQDGQVFAMAIFILILFVGFSGSFAQRLGWVLAFHAFSLVLVPFRGISLSILDIMTLFLAAESLVALRLRNAAFSTAGLLVLGLLAAVCVSVVFSPVLLRIVGPSIRFSILLLLFLATDRLEFSAEALQTLRYGMAYMFPVALILFYFNGDLAKILEDVQGGIRPNHSQYLPWSFSLVFPWFMVRSRRSLLIFPLACACVVTTWLGRSRAMIVAAVLTFLVLLLVRLKTRLSLFLLASTLAIFGAAGVNYLDEVQEAVAGWASSPGSDEIRLRKMRMCMQIFVENPLFGAGPASEWAVSQQRDGLAAVSENSLVQALAELGLVGTTIFFSTIFYLLWRSIALFRVGAIGKGYLGVVMIMFIALLATLAIGSDAMTTPVWLLLVVINKHLGEALTEISPAPHASASLAAPRPAQSS